MANKSKIIGDLEQVVLNMHSLGNNPSVIGEKIGVSKDTVKLFLKKKNLIPHQRQLTIKNDQYQQFINDVKNNPLINWSKHRKKFKISFDKAKNLLIENGINVRDRRQAAAAKIMSIEEAQARLPAGAGTIVKIDSLDGRYIIKTEDGFVYKKKQTKLFQGDPRNKCGFPLNNETFQKKLDKIGAKLVDDFIGAKKPGTVVCKNGHTRTLEHAANVFRGNCPDCISWGVSNAELELLAWIQQYYPSAHKLKLPVADGVKKLGRKKELDIYIPELKLGIEYCGTYFHSKSGVNHHEKMLEAQAVGIRTVFLFDFDFKENSEKVYSYLKSLLKVNPTKIHARKCNIEVITKEEGNLFLKNNHLQGQDDMGLKYFGLFFISELVGVVCSGDHPRGKKEPNTTYLTRLCFKQGVSVTGGSSKLFKHLADHTKSIGNSQIVSWSDNRWSFGNVYVKLGFCMERPMRKSGSRKGQYMGLKDGSIWPEPIFYSKGRSVTKNMAKKLENQGVEVLKTYDLGKKKWVFKITT